MWTRQVLKQIFSIRVVIVLLVIEMASRGKRSKVDFSRQKVIFLKHKNLLLPTLPKRTNPIYDTYDAIYL